MDSKLPINLTIADRVYSFNINREDEALWREATKEINEKLLQYKQTLKDKDNQDFLALISLQYLMKLLELQRSTDIRPIIAELENITTKIGYLLGKQ